ncbi:phage minor structural protein%2C N-terminal region [uncultured Clostridium sp.]|uniref:phage tail protein n=1 Tax=uncultured Clostridium sp. TaxID=59620 RepID=UPI00082117BE|nr:phage tail protein [uncultured Clostridium sp.]SCK04356.1 phage minor structural protein%2C N-terminal region [uncultured Clostridium sp.]
MYKITLVNGREKVLLHHYSNDPDSPKVLTAKGKFGLNAVPSLTLDIPAIHNAFNLFQEYKSHILVEDEENNEVFYGRMINPTDSFNNGISRLLIFEGELAYLNDSTIRPREWHDYSVKDFLREILEEHNSQVEEYKKIYLGNVTVSANLYRMANYDKTLPFLLDRLPKRLGGFFVLRKVNGIKYLDYLLDVGQTSNQAIVFGENMLDYQVECDTTSIYTKLVPLGADKSNGTQESKVGNRLTITEVNGGKDYLINEKAAAVYGLIETTNTWDDVTVASNLKRKGEEYLEEISKPKRSLKMKIADLHEINNNYDKYHIGDDVPVKCKVFGVDESFRIIEMAIDFLNPLNTTYTFGNKIGTLTDKQIIMQNSQAKIESFFNENGLLSNFLDGTINLLSNNMRAMVETADKHNGTAILFECKVPGDLYGAMAVGTKGFMIADELKADGSWNWKTFGTAKGFFADLIVAGTMLADRIRGGVLESIDGSIQIDLSDTSSGIQFKQNGKKAIDILGSIMKFYDWDGEGDAIAQFFSSRLNSDENRTGLVIANKTNSYLTLGYERNGLFYPYIRLDKDNADKITNSPITIFEEIDFKGSQFWFGYGINSIYKATSDNLVASVKNGFILLDRGSGKYIASFRKGRSYFSDDDKIYFDSTPTYFSFFNDGQAYFWKEKQQEKLWCNYNFTVDKKLHVNGDLAVVGNKNCIQATENYGDRLFYSIEDCESYLTDRSMEVFTVEETAEGTYERVILLDNIFKEAVRVDNNYTVEVIKQGWGDYRVKEQNENYFIVESDRKDFAFKYVITAKRRGFENIRLEEYHKHFNEQEAPEAIENKVNEVAYEHEDN